MMRGNAIFDPSTWLPRPRSSAREGTARSRYPVVPGNSAPECTHGRTVYEHEGILFDLESGTFTSTALGQTVTRPMNPAILAAMQEIGFDAWIAKTTEGRFLEKGRKHGGLSTPLD